MTVYLASYDVETERCLPGVRAIANQHKKYQIPATFFVVGELLEEDRWATEFAKMLDDPLFSIQNHTYSHILLRFGNEVDDEYLGTLSNELENTNRLIERYFNQTPVGLRSPMGFEHGLSGESSTLKVLWHNHIRFVSSQALGPHGTVPSLLSDAYHYDEEDILHPILEIPVHGWHDNVLKGYNYCPALWPPEYDWSVLQRPPATPQEEFSIYRTWCEKAMEIKLKHFAPIFHPWAVNRFNREAETIGLLLDHVVTNNIPTDTYEGFWQKIEEKVPV
jgi:peptidoglycan/xylan/chitin deacetylase (PgdA/CDA1 family)